MIAIKRKSDNLVIYLFDDYKIVRWRNGLLTAPVYAGDIKESLYEVVNVPAPPFKFIGGLCSYIDEEWCIKDTVTYNERLEAKDTSVFDLLRELAALRYSVETGGYTWNNLSVNSDDRSQFKAFSEYMSAVSGARVSGSKWKFNDGEFRALTNEQFIDMFTTGAAFITKCYNTESACINIINSGGFTGILNTLWKQEWSK